MADASTEYNQHRDRARAAIARLKEADRRQREARAERDREVRAMLNAPGASLGSVAADLGLSKSLVALIHREGRAIFTNVEEARRYIDEHDT